MQKPFFKVLFFFSQVPFLTDSFYLYFFGTKNRYNKMGPWYYDALFMWRNGLNTNNTRKLISINNLLLLVRYIQYTGINILS